MRNTIKKIQQLKNKRPISCLTAYSSSISKIVDEYVDIILVGDSLGNAVYGMKNTQSVTLDMMRNHGKAVFQSSKKALTIIDMPFNSYQNPKRALNNARNLLEYTKCQFCKDDNRRGAGFDKPALSDQEGGSTCKCVSLSSFGHSGFTGTLAWADPETGIVFLDTFWRLKHRG